MTLNRIAKVLLSTQPKSRVNAVLLSSFLTIIVLGFRYLLLYLGAIERLTRGDRTGQFLEYPGLYVLLLVIGAFIGSLISLVNLEFLEVDGRSKLFDRNYLLILIFQSVMGMTLVQAAIGGLSNIMGLNVDTIDSATYPAVMSSVIWSAVLCACFQLQPSALRRAAPRRLC